MSARAPLDIDAELVRAETRPATTIEFVHERGNEALDIVGTTHASTLLVSDRLIDVFRGERFSGWTTFPASISLRDGSKLTSHSGLAVTGRCGPVDDDLSAEVVLPPPTPGGRPRRALRGICFQADSWDGSDVFTSTAGGGMVVVVEAVKRAVENAGLTNVAFERLSTFD